MTWREVPGDPLTSQIPQTRLLIETPRPTWPQVPDPDSPSFLHLKPGSIARVRTWRGVKTWKIRVIMYGTTRRHKRQRFFVGMDTKGWCHRAWVRQIISIEAAR